ncbi:glycosyltransferase family 39 protein [Streptomyces sp. NPDC029216]|uniref:glycosyltransferase family 39 protein n=1 Tax=Streptomyces sp. NPDC029216 TaxID=3154701 RepID=UPI0033FCD0DA
MDGFTVGRTVAWADGSWADGAGADGSGCAALGGGLVGGAVGGALGRAVVDSMAPAGADPPLSHPARDTAASSTAAAAPGARIARTPTSAGHRYRPRVWRPRPATESTPEDDIHRTAPWRWLPPLLTVLLLGLWGLERGPGGGSMWRDESTTWQVAHRPAGALRDLLGQVDAVHGLYYALMHLVFGLWGDGGLWALRLPSVAGTALAAAGVAAVAHRLAGERAALWAGVTYALLPPVQMYGQEGRSYALVAAAVAWATYLMLRERWAAYAAVLLLGCWLHEFAVLALLAHGCAAGRVRGWRWAAGAVAAGLLPLAVLSAGQAERQLGWLGRPGWEDWAAYGGVVGVVLLLVWGGGGGGGGVLGAGSGSGAGSAELVRVAVPLALLPPGLLMAVSLVHPWYVDRYVLYALGGLALLAGAGLAGVRGWVPWVLVAVLLVPLGVWSAWLRTPDSRKDDVLAVAAAVREKARPGDAVLFMPSRRREWLLSSPGLYAGLRDVALADTPATSHTLHGTELPPDRVREALRASPRVIALLDPEGQPLDPYPTESAKRETLSADFARCSVTEVRGARVAVYARRGGGCG